jgi:hypothetical protein
MVKRLMTIALLFCAALALAGGDDIKWTKSKPITYYGPATDLSQFGSELVDIGNRYRLMWVLQFDSDLEHIRVVWNSWELTGTALKNIRKNKKISEAEFNTEVEKSKNRLTRYLVFNVSVVPMTKDFYEKSAKDYWHFRLYSEKGEIELVDIDDRADATFIDLTGSGDYAVPVYTNTYHVYFRNPYEEDKPEYLQLIVEGGRFKRGFEWRFKQP